MPVKDVIDEKENNHGKGFIEFLTENKLCVLNGRFDKDKNNFTSAGHRGSVVDYIFCPHDNFEYYSHFSVTICKELINKYGLPPLVSEKSKPPDHSLLKVTIQVTGLTMSNLTSTDNSSRPVTDKINGYNLFKIPDNFMNNEEACKELLDLINERETCRENQMHVDNLYNKLITCILRYIKILR